MYRKAYGTLVAVRRGDKLRSLEAWVRRQVELYAMWQAGDKSAMEEEHVRSLSFIGFPEIVTRQALEEAERKRNAEESKEPNGLARVPESSERCRSTLLPVGPPAPSGHHALNPAQYVPVWYQEGNSPWPHHTMTRLKWQQRNYV